MYATHFRVTWFNWWLNDCHTERWRHRGGGLWSDAKYMSTLWGLKCPSWPLARHSCAVSHSIRIHKAASSKDTWDLLQTSTPAQVLLGISAFFKKKSCSWNILLCSGGWSGLSANNVLSHRMEILQPSWAGEGQGCLQTKSGVSLSELMAPWSLLISGAYLSF